MSANASHQEPIPDLAGPETSPGDAAVPAQGAAAATKVFVVKLRNLETRSWGDQTEVSASSAQDAAEMLAGARLTAGTGQRTDLRARVWATPFGSRPDTAFYVDRSETARTDAPFTIVPDERSAWKGAAGGA